MPLGKGNFGILTIAYFFRALYATEIEASISKKRQGKARQGKARQGKARRGEARRGEARRGEARQGKVTLG
jgi:hypothetical protein